MSKSKWSAEFRTVVSQEYLDGRGSYGFLADKYHIGYEIIRRWVVAYKVHPTFYNPGLNYIMLIENLGITFQKGRSIWQMQEEKQLLKNA